jgi:hypothetical protein
VENNCKKGSKELIEMLGGLGRQGGGAGVYEIFWGKWCEATKTTKDASRGRRS